MVEYINQLRTCGMDPRQAAREGAELRLRPIMMTMLVATLGLLPAAISHDIGSDLQRSFAIVIVGGLIVELIVSLVMMPTLYVFWARPGDKLLPAELEFVEEGEHVDWDGNLWSDARPRPSSSVVAGRGARRSTDKYLSVSCFLGWLPLDFIFP